ncbi:RNA polymerase sigma factor [Planctomycetota bacterium]
MDITDLDLELVRQYRLGDGQAFMVLYKKYRNPLYSYLLSLLGSRNLADDVFQDMFLWFKQHINAFEKVKSFKGYFFRVARNRAMDLLKQLRKEQKQFIVDGGEALLNYPSQSFKDWSFEEVEYLNHILYKLPGEQREVVVLRVLNGYSFGEIANITGVSVSTLESRFHYAKQSLVRWINAGKN